MKPHIEKSGSLWVCSRNGVQAMGHSPEAALAGLVRIEDRSNAMQQIAVLRRHADFYVECSRYPNRHEVLRKVADMAWQFYAEHGNG